MPSTDNLCFRPLARVRGAIASIGATLLIAACSGTAPPPPSTAEDFYNEGLARLEPNRVLLFFKTVDFQRAIPAFQEVIDNFPFSEFAPLAELQIADAYLALGRYEQAASFYQDFIELHPSHPRVPYALLNNGRCAFDQMLAPDQDQAKTQEAIAQFDALLARFPKSDLIEEAQQLRGDALDRLALSEVNVGDFYFENEKWSAAISRYRNALSQSKTHPGNQRTRARLGLALRQAGQLTAGDNVLGEVVAEDIDDALREEIALAIGGEAARLDPGFRLWPFGEAYPAPDQPGVGPREDAERTLPVNRLVERAPEPEPVPVATDEGGSWLGWLWPFGGDDAPAASPAPVAITDSTQTADESDGGSWLGWLWPFGGDDGAEPSAAAAPEPVPAPEAESSGWFGWLWPF